MNILPTIANLRLIENEIDLAGSQILFDQTIKCILEALTEPASFLLMVN